MFGIGGGELVYHVYCINAFGSDKVPEWHTMGKQWLSLKNTTNVLKVKYKRSRGQWS
jgi:hypothetical protein